VEFLSWIENTDTITWIRESSSQLGYTLYLALHTIGLVFLMGPTMVMAARVYDLIPDLPISPMIKFRPLMRTGFWITAVSGTVLFCTAPVSFVRNGVFIVKVASVIVGYVITNRFISQVVAKGPSIDTQLPANSKVLMGWAMFFWIIGVTAGRLTAYSARVVQQSTIAGLIAFGLVFAVVIAGRRMGLIGGPTAGYVPPSAGKGV
jgi:hypothetical protein